MKVKNNLIKTLAIVGLLFSTNLSAIDANEIEYENSIKVMNEKLMDCKDKENGCKRHEIGKGRLDELKEKGILDDNDINNIKKYMNEHKDEIRKEMYEKKVKEIDNMVSEKVISKEKGEALKEHIKEKFEKRNKK